MRRKKSTYTNIPAEQEVLRFYSYVNPMPQGPLRCLLWVRATRDKIRSSYSPEKISPEQN